MDVVNLFRLIRRQRIVVGILGTLGIGALVMLYLSVPVTYRASGSAVLLKPQVTSSPPTTTPGASPGQTAPTTSAAPDNPYVGLNDMSVVLDIVTRRMKTPTVVTRLAEQGVGSFTLGANLDFYRGPILDYSADGARREDAVRGAAVVREEIRRQLDELQAQQGVTAGDFIRLDGAVTPTDTTTIITSKVRVIGAATVALVLVVLSAALLVDARRKRRSDATNDHVAHAPQWPSAPGTFQMPPPTPSTAPTPPTESPEFREPSYWSAQR